MRRILAVLIVLLGVASPSEAQVIYDAPARVWFYGSTCPATWAAMTPPQTRAPLPDTYHVTRPTGGPRLVLSLAAVRSAFTVDGIFQNVALDDALALGTVVSLRPGRAAQVGCAWRPMGGSP